MAEDVDDLVDELRVGGQLEAPFFFIRSGMSLSLPLVMANLGLLGALLAVKLILKSTAVHLLARRYARRHAVFTTLLMSTGHTFGTVLATYGYMAGILNRAQFSVLLSVVVLTAVLPTAIAERFFAPDAAAETDAGHATETERILDR